MNVAFSAAAGSAGVKYNHVTSVFFYKKGLYFVKKIIMRKVTTTYSCEMNVME